MPSILTELKSRKPPARCPVRNKPTKGLPLYDVPMSLRAAVALWARRRNVVLSASKRNESCRIKRWQEADGLHALLCEHLRVLGKYRTNAQIDFCAGWKYTVYKS